MKGWFVTFQPSVKYGLCLRFSGNPPAPWGQWSNGRHQISTWSSWLTHEAPVSFCAFGKTVVIFERLCPSVTADCQTVIIISHDGNVNHNMYVLRIAYFVCSYSQLREDQPNVSILNRTGALAQLRFNLACLCLLLLATWPQRPWNLPVGPGRPNVCVPVLRSNLSGKGKGYPLIHSWPPHRFINLGSAPKSWELLIINYLWE